jgi:Ca2+-binding RTX toxin-like protein
VIDKGRFARVDEEGGWQGRFVSEPYAALSGSFGRAAATTGTTARVDSVHVAAGGSYTGTIAVADEVDTISFDVVAGQTYMVSMRGTGVDPLVDSYLTLLNQNQGIVTIDDDGGVRTNSLITFTANRTGRWQVSAEGFPGDGGTGEYRIDFRKRGTDAVPGDTDSNVALAPNATTFGFIETSGDIDVYKIELEAGLFYTFELAGGADQETDAEAMPAGELDTIIGLLDAEGREVASNDDLSFPYDISSGVGFGPTRSGTYYVQVDAYPGETGGYALEVQEIDVAGLDPLDSIDWGTQVASNHVTVYFAAAGERFGGMTSNGWNNYQKAQAMAALEEYAEVSGLTFSIATSRNGATFKLVTTESAEFLGIFTPPGETGAGVGGFAVNGEGWDNVGGLGQGGFGFVTLLHEFGHGLGLAHPHDDGGTSTIMPGVAGPFGSLGPYDLNQGVYTTVSYNDGWAKHPDAVDGAPPRFPTSYGWQGGPSALDIAVIQQKYGANTEHNSGNNVYALPTGNRAGTFYTTIWDGGGIDTIRHGGGGVATIDLTAATLDFSPTGGGVVSYAGGVFGGFTIAHGVVIENAIGGSGSDTITGNAAANLIDGGLDVDVMAGGAGDDRYIVSQSADIVREAAGGGRDTIMSAWNYQLDRGCHVETLTTIDQPGTGNINLSGNEIANTVIGHIGRNILRGEGRGDSLSGLGGNDRLIGGAGRDTLTGGDGSDSFYFDSALNASTNVDQILDFTAADTIVLDRTIFTSIAADGAIAPGAFRNGVAAQDANDRILYEAATGRIFYDADGTGDAAAVLFAKVDAGTLLTSQDFIAVA